MKGLGLFTHALGVCMVSTILASCGTNSAMVPQGNRADASAHFLSQTPAFAPQPGRSNYNEDVLYSFRGVFGDGRAPYSNLIFDSQGSLYGTAGGGLAWGTVFKLTPSGSGYSERVLYDFKSKGDGGAPTGGLIFDTKGALYGETWRGGNNDGGTVFKLTPSGSGYSESVLYSFCAKSNCADGKFPSGGVIFGNDGALYGTTEAGGPNPHCWSSANGCGTVFKLTPSGASYTEKVLYAFCTATCDSGAYPQAGVVLGKDGAFYGMTPIDLDQCLDFSLYGYCGTVFKLTRSGSRYTETTIYKFCAKPSCVDGADPQANLIFDKKGALWGTTFYGGTDNLGTAFKLTQSGSSYAETFSYSFKGRRGGAYPYAGLLLGKDGALYGTTTSGGRMCYSSQGCGTVFRLAPSRSGYTEKVIHRFVGTDGANPRGGLILNDQGGLYGTTVDGGANECPRFGSGCGAVFVLSP